MKGSSIHEGELVDRTIFQCSSKTYVHMRIDSHGNFHTGPGQFIMLETGGDCYLDRPFSIMDAFGGMFELLIEVKGKGTRNLLSLETGDIVRFKGACGKRLDVLTEHPGKKVDLVAGGMGIVPLYSFCWEAMREGRREDISLFFGAESRDFFDGFRKHLNFPDAFKGVEIHLVPFNESGMTVVDYYRENMGRSGRSPHHVISCGPHDMQEAVQEMILQMDVTGHLLLERRMGCGRGMCMGCPVWVVEGGRESVEMTCTDGPSFAVGHGRKVIF